MKDKKIGKQLIKWVEKLHKAGATFAEGDIAKCHPVIRVQISAIHATLAASTESELYLELENAFDDAMDEASDQKDYGRPMMFLP